MLRPDLTPPDGIDERHSDRPGRRRANPGPLIAIGLLLAVALLGWLGGQPHPVRTVSNAMVRLTLTNPETLRNGMFFETRILVEPRQPIADLVLGVSPRLWHDITINSAIPAPEKEEFADGMFRMSYGKAEPGKPIAIKFDGQVNPPLIGDNGGEIALFDGERELIRMSAPKRVLP